MVRSRKILANKDYTDIPMANLIVYTYGFSQDIGFKNGLDVYLALCFKV
jgi:hypothetical protein